MEKGAYESVREETCHTGEEVYKRISREKRKGRNVIKLQSQQNKKPKIMFQSGC